MATHANPQYLNPGDEEEEVVTGSALSKIEEADRSHMIRTAKDYPRSITKFVHDLTEIACLSQPTAMAMIYSLPRAGKQLVGPSVRFAEAVAACWGNLRVGVEVVDVDRQEGVVTSEGRYYDCEKNYGFALRKRRRIVAKVINADAIQVTGDAGSSIALRDAILRGVPKAIWEPVWERARETAAGSAKSMEQVRGALLQHFRALGITDVQVFNSLGVSGPADIGGDQLLAMQAWKKQLNEGESTIEDIFGSPLDDQIQQAMNDLGWNGTKQRLSRDAFKGKREDHLKYLQEQLAKTGAVEATKESPKATPIRKEEPKPAAVVVDAQLEQEAAQESLPVQAKQTNGKQSIAWG